MFDVIAHPWIDFYMTFRKEHAKEFEGQSAPAVAKAAGEAYKKQQKPKSD